MTLPTPQEVYILSRRKAVNFILDELEMAKLKHPTWPATLMGQTMKVAEEALEVVQAANHVDEGTGNIDKVRIELAHTGAMCIRMLMNLEQEA